MRTTQAKNKKEIAALKENEKQLIEMEEKLEDEAMEIEEEILVEEGEDGEYLVKQRWTENLIRQRANNFATFIVFTLVFGLRFISVNSILALS